MSNTNLPNPGFANADLKNPFVGPRSIEEGQKIFGRDREIQALYYKLSADRIVLLYSPSGAGKTSMIQAGLIPRLRESFEVWGPIRVNQELKIGPAGANRYSLSCKLRIDPAAPLNELGPSVSLSEFVASRRAKLKLKRIEELKELGDEDEADEGDENIVLVFDQFEEVLTTDPLDLATKKAFFRELGSLLQGDRHLWALFTIREDYLAQLDPYCDDLPTHLNNRFRIDLLARPEAQKAIESLGWVGKPRRSFSERAISGLLNDLTAVKVQRPDGKIVSAQGNSVEPLHLQVVCRNLWERLKPGQVIIETSDVAEFGDVTEALAGYYAASVAEIAHGDKRTERRIREWVGRLITPADTRGQVQRGEGKTQDLDNDKEVSSLVHSHLIRGEIRAGATWYELSHDRLIPPVKEDNRHWLEANLSPLQKQAALWSQQDEPDGLLFRGDQLKAAEAEAVSLELDSTETKFLQAAKRARARRSTAVGSVTAVMLSLSILAGLAVWQGEKARKAQHQADIALVHSLVNSGKSKLSTNTEVDDLASMVAVLQAERTLRDLKDATPELRALVHGALQKVVYGAQERNRFLIAGNVLVGRFNKDGSRIAAIDDSGTVYRWERSGKKLDEFQGPSKQYGITAAAFSDDLNTLVTVHIDPNDGDKSSVVLVWDMNLQKQIARLDSLDGVVFRVAIDPAGKLIATTGQGGLHLWDTAGVELKHWGRFPEPSSAVAFSPDGNQLAWSSYAGVRILDLTGAHSVQELVRAKSSSKDAGEDLSLEFVPKQHSLMVSGALYDLDTPGRPGVKTDATTFSPDGLWVAKSTDGIPEVYQSWTGHNVAWLAGRKGDKFEAFGPGRLALTSGQDHSIRLWDLSPRYVTEFGKSLNVATSIRPRVYVSNFANLFELWSPEGHPLGQFEWHDGPFANENALSPDATGLVACKGTIGRCRVWDTKTGLFNEFTVSRPLLGLATFSGKLALVTAYKSDVEIEDVFGSTLSKFSLPAGTISTVLNADGTLLISASNTGVSVWDLNGQRRGGFNTSLPAMSQVLPGSDSLRIAIAIRVTTSRAKGTILVYDQSGKPIASFVDSFRASLSPDGKLLAIPDGQFGVPTIYDVETQKPIAQFAGNGDDQFTFTPDGKFVLIAGTDEPARLCRVETTEELVTEACQWIGGYLQNYPNVSQDDRALCPQ